MKNYSHGKFLLGRGFTLVEVQVTSAIVLLIAALVLSMVVFMMKLYSKTDIRNSVSESYRSLNRVLLEKGNMANQSFVYPRFDRASNLPIVSVATQHSVLGESGGVAFPYSGDYLVFVYYSFSDLKTSPDMMGVSRIVGVFRENSGSVLSNIRYFDSDQDNWGQTFSKAKPVMLNDTVTVESLLPNSSDYTRFRVLAKHSMGVVSEGAANDYLGMFYVPFYGVTSVSGLIIRPTSESGGGVAGFQSQTAFNLTVSQRTK